MIDSPSPENQSQLPLSDQNVDFLPGRPPFSVNACGFMVPNILEMPNTQSFFAEFHRLNQDSAIFSFRKVAEKLRWPSSYLNDLISGRRDLTLLRAIEFSQFAEMTGIESERLIALALRDSDTGRVYNYFDSQMKTTQNFELRVNPQSFQCDPLQDRVTVHENPVSPLSYVVLAQFSWKNETYTLGKLEEDLNLIWGLYFNPEEMTREKIENSLTELVSRQFISQKNGLFNLEKVAFFAGFQQALASELLHRIVDRGAKRRLNPQTQAPPRGIYRSGLTEFPTELIPDLQDRITGLANWISEMSGNSRNSAEYSPEKVHLIKYDLFYRSMILPGEISENL